MRLPKIDQSIERVETVNVPLTLGFLQVSAVRREVDEETVKLLSHLLYHRLVQTQFHHPVTNPQHSSLSTRELTRQGLDRGDVPRRRVHRLDKRLVARVCRRASVPDLSPHNVRELLEDLRPPMLEARSYLNLDPAPIVLYRQMQGAIAVAGLRPPVLISTPEEAPRAPSDHCGARRIPLHEDDADAGQILDRAESGIPAELLDRRLLGLRSRSDHETEACLESLLHELHRCQVGRENLAQLCAVIVADDSALSDPISQLVDLSSGPPAHSQARLNVAISS